jgi:cell division septation protein DedD
VGQVQLGRDDGFHEIQLNGKQLVFLFMAATVVSVVIFLCGVLVGRSVRTQREALADPPVGTVADATPQPAPAPAPPDTKASPADKFTYPDLDKPKGTVEPLRSTSSASPSSKAASPPARSEPSSKSAPAAKAPPPAGKSASADKPGPGDQIAPADKAPSADKPAPEKAASQAPADKDKPLTTAGQDAGAPADRGGAEPSGQGFAVQIAALNVRSEADAIAKRLATKGYSVYVLAPPSGTPSVFRVRVGKFSTRREAETVAAKLQKEEQFKPWVTR